MGKYAEQYRQMLSLLRTGKLDGITPKVIRNAYIELRSMNLNYFYSAEEVQSMDEDGGLDVRPMTFGPPPKRSKLYLDLETDQSIETRCVEDIPDSNSNTGKEACTFQPICIIIEC